MNDLLMGLFASLNKISVQGRQNVQALTECFLWLDEMGQLQKETETNQAGDEISDE